MTRRWRIRLSALFLLLFVYGLIFWGMGCADYMVLHPTRNAIEVPGGKPFDISFDDKSLEVWVGQTRIRRTEENLAYVLDFSPNAGRAEWGLLYGLGKWEGLPIEYWALNYPGYGASDGPATLEGVHRAALAAYDALAKKAAGKPIFLTGYSLGTAAALHVAANRPVAGLYLYAPPPLRQLIMEKYGWWNLWLLAYPIARDVPPQLDSLANGAQCSAPAFFVLGELDAFVDYKYQQRVAAAYAGPKRVLSLKVTHDDDPEQAHRREVNEGVIWLWGRAVQLADAHSTTKPGG